MSGVICGSMPSRRSIHAPAWRCKDVSFEVDKGEFLFLAGQSGSGKSTLLKLLSLAERPTSGEVKRERLFVRHAA